MNGTDQADYYLSQLSPGQLMVLDFERYPRSQMTLRQAEDFIYRVLAMTGNLPVLYYGELVRELEEGGRIATDSILRQCPAWMSRYSERQPVPIKGQDLVMWQYTGDGVGPLPHRVEGCRNEADLSVWVGNPADMKQFVLKHSYQEAAG